MKIPCVVIVWHDADMTYRCLSNLAQYPFEFYVIHNPSENTKAVNQAIQEAVFMPKIWELPENRGAEAFLSTMSLLAGIRRYNNVVCTDGDVVLEDVTKTVEAQIELLKNPNVLCAGSRIRMDNLPLKTFPESKNWVPAFEDRGEYLAGPGPHHFLMFRGKDIWPMLLRMREQKQNWVDTAIGDYARHTGRDFAILKDHWHRHLSWDAYADRNHPYTKERLKRSFDETWKK